MKGFIALLIFIILEMLIPYKKERIFKWGVVSDLAWYVDVQPMVIQTIYHKYVNIPFFHGIDVSHLSFVVQFIIAFFAMELGYYWFHRLLHVSETLWKFHQLHHSITELNCISASRNHFVDIALGLVVASIVYACFNGFNNGIFPLFGFLYSVHGIYKHANIRFKIGALQYFIIGSEMHRAHHLKDARYQMANYGNIVSVYDWIFGTAYYPNESDYAGIPYGTDKEYSDNFVTHNIQIFKPDNWKNDPVVRFFKRIKLPWLFVRPIHQINSVEEAKTK